MIHNPNSFPRPGRLAALRRFAIAITSLNLLGHTVLGFEQSLAQPLVALATAYGLELLMEFVDASTRNRQPAFWGGGPQKLIDFLLPAHISGLAVAMLLYANDALLPIAFATAAAIGSKAWFRIPIEGKLRHCFNPSNFGITITLLLFPWVGIAPPYHFTENLTGVGDWLLPGLIVCTGTFLNARFTRKLPLIGGWVGGFILQALLRSWVFGTPLVAALAPVTGVAFVLFTFYMVTDPGTTPSPPLNQAIFGGAVAATYGILMVLHIVFGFFFALAAVSLVRGIGLSIQDLAFKDQQRSLSVPLLSMAKEV